MILAERWPWRRLWRTCVGWDRGASIVTQGDHWCLMISGNRIGDWHAVAGNSDQRAGLV